LKSFIHDTNTYIYLNIGNYIKQYFGYITSEGDTVVYINCFDKRSELTALKDFHIDWKREIVSVFDGGPSYFRLRYNITKKKFFGLMINGYG
jgi:hypothetical protein